MADGLFAAFCAAGLWPGVTRAIADKLPAAGIQSPDDVSVASLGKVPSLGAKKAERLAKTFAQAAPRYAVAELLHEAGMPLRAAAGIVDALGSHAAQALAADPWRVLDSGLVQPRDSDAFALRTLPQRPGKEDRRRGRAFTVHILTRAARDGHTQAGEATVAAALAGLDVPEPAAAIDAAVDDGAVTDVASYDEAGEPHRLLSLTRYAMAEESIGEGIARLLATAEPLATPEGATAIAGGLDPAQREAVQEVAAHGVVVLHGGPGTGKSRTVAAVVELAAARHVARVGDAPAARHKRIARAAPTGRAAKRLEELTGHEAMTLHRLLGAQGTSGEFLRGETWPLDADVVVVDETSMLDVDLAAALVEACADGTHLLLVGDPAQLPSIGPGRVLGDLIDSGSLGVTELTTLYRQEQGGAIARLATAVRGGALPRGGSPGARVV